MLFKQTIVKKPGESYLNGLTTSDLGEPEFDKLLQQHEQYVKALKRCGVAVHELEPSEEFPDSCFVEDAAVLVPEFAVITNPGAESRNKEIIEIEQVLKNYYDEFRYIQAPGTLDGGDVMQIDKNFYIGISDRTNQEGADQLKKILEDAGYHATIMTLEEFFHLKTGITFLGNNTVVAAGEFIDHPAFAEYKKIIVPAEEEYTANTIRVNDHVIVPAGFPKTKHKIEEAGFSVIEVEVSEFQKHDGGLSCLSLRF
ncbi:N(G),N(G)-dimethylarginine dimethylaminohydrolase [Sporosarcina sp. PTS2304]|uniref:dimethylarginine dimethylaminohydrolase family protein n=1 Tax=Sporosarcina sp. PTS2304 TaxID=2283194 RepID=UPI000E0D3C8D|nr:arginine deiminase family protein [Sporosarcina sp. PTS2304]AXI01218.1 N(G),N(G)-dimethylarginine dimethylaminohydrolase [Sporosarcina sp. PTS2304]